MINQSHPLIVWFNHFYFYFHLKLYINIFNMHTIRFSWLKKNIFFLNKQKLTLFDIYLSQLRIVFQLLKLVQVKK